MKRCPQCSFIYEDDQRLCDWDGGELVPVSGPLPMPEIVAPRPTVPPVMSRRRVFTVLPLAGVILAAALFLIFYVVPQRAALRDKDHPSPTTLADTPQPDSKVVLTPTPVAFTPPPAPPPPTTNVKEIKRAAPKPRRPTIDSRPALPKQGEKTPQTVTVASPKTVVVPSPKKESKFGSILKKTGRLLKKPFEF